MITYCDQRRREPKTKILSVGSSIRHFFIPHNLYKNINSSAIVYLSSKRVNVKNIISLLYCINYKQYCRVKTNKLKCSY